MGVNFPIYGVHLSENYFQILSTAMVPQVIHCFYKSQDVMQKIHKMYFREKVRKDK
jgi:hypothetical protein